MAKKKIKKFLKSVAPLAIAGLGAAMLGRRKGRGFTNADAIKAMTSNKAMRNSMMQNPMVTTEDLMEFDQSMPFGMGLAAKKGGRIVKGKKAAVRTKGFAAKKKQANKMRKK